MARFTLWILLPLVISLSACTQKPADPPQINSFKATPASLKNIAPVTLSWEVTGASSLSIEPGIGTVTGTSKTVEVASSTTFTLTTKNASGSVNAEAKVTVTIAPFSYEIDPSVKPSLTSLEGNRPVTAIQDAAGVVSSYVLGEVAVYPTNQAELDGFLSRHGGTVIGTNAVPEPPAGLGITLDPNYKTPTEYLVKVDASTFDPKTFAVDMNRLGVGGAFKFSSDEGVRLMALITNEKASGHKVSPNYVNSPNAVMLSTREQPSGGGFDDAFSASLFPRYQNNGSKASVVQAWQWIAAHGISRRVRVAIIDAGFWVNASGNPMTAPGDGSDMPNNPVQYDFVGNDYVVGAQGVPGNLWHGTGATGVATGIVNNSAAAAGTGGTIADPILFHIDYTNRQTRWAIRTSMAWGADVVNMSFAGNCNQRCRIDERDNDVYSAAASAGVVLVASAGNSGIDTGADNFVHPCINDGVICVGALADNGNTRFTSATWSSNFGSQVAIWAPTNVRTMSRPDDNSNNLTTMPNFVGTSASSPFVAGIAAMMKAINPALNTEDVRNILRDTGWADSPDGSVSRYVNALEAVKRTSNYVLPPDRFEANNSSASATNLPSGQYNDLNLHSSTDNDFYRVGIVGPTLVNLDLTYPSGLGKVFLPPSGREATLACGGFEQLGYTPSVNKVQVVYRLSTGSFVFSVAGGNPIPYDLGLQLSARGIAPDAYEPNDTLAQKRYIGDGRYINATLHTASDVDYFEFYSPGNFKTIVLSMRSGVTIQSSDNPLTLDIYDNKDNFYQRVSASADCRTQAELTLPQGYWTVRVSGNAPGAYWLWMGSKSEQHPLIDISVLIYLILHPNVPVEFVVKDKEAWFLVEKRSDSGIKGLNLYTPGLHLALYSEAGKLIAEGQPEDFRGSHGEALSLPQALSDPHYLVRLTRTQEDVEVAQGREFPLIPASLEMVVPTTGSR